MYEVDKPYHDETMQALVVYCSDGRQCDQCDLFIEQGLGIARYDRVVLPGGPGVLAMFANTKQGVAPKVLGEIAFLVERHVITRIVLIQHEDCGFYRAGFPEDGSSLHRQYVDCCAVADLLRQTLGDVAVESYMARRSTTGVLFEPIVDDPKHPD